MLINLDEKNYSRTLEEVYKKISINGYQFLSDSQTGSFHSYIRSLFYNIDGFSVEEYPEQIAIFDSPSTIDFNLIFTGSRVQIGEGIIPKSFSLTYNNLYTFTDDGLGNIYHNDLLVGNIFYDHGVALFDHTLNFSGSVTPLDVMRFNPNLVEIDFTKKNSVIKTRISFFYGDDYTLYSSNPTFNKEIHTPYITKIVLYNIKNEPIMVVKPSKPISTKQDLYFILEHITV